MGKREQSPLNGTLDTIDELLGREIVWSAHHSTWGAIDQLVDLTVMLRYPVSYKIASQAMAEDAVIPGSFLIVTCLIHPRSQLPIEKGDNLLDCPMSEIWTARAAKSENINRCDFKLLLELLK